MAYTNQILAVVFLAVAIAPVLAEPQSEMFPNMTPECALVLPNLLEKCFIIVRVTPTDECCNDLKSANTTEVTCLCDNYIANPTTVNITRPYTTGITTKCGVFDKYSCDGTSKGGETNKGEGPSSNSSSDSNGKDTSTSKVNGGRANMVAASVGVFGLLTSLLFVMF